MPNSSPDNGTSRKTYGILEEVVGCIVALIVLPLQYIWVMAWLTFFGVIGYCILGALVQVAWERM